jgi:large subunit ribosomal protein L3
MLKGLIGKKVGMARLFLSGSETVPVTVLQMGPCVVVQPKTRDKEGYEAVQLGFDPVKAERVTRPQAGHFKARGTSAFRFLREFKVDDASQYQPGQTVLVDLFTIGERVDVIGTTKGRGFSGVIKRHGFSGGRKTHGSNSHRIPGSIGTSATPSRVLKGKKMPGHYGHARQTVKNLIVIDVRPDENLLLVRGAVPGANGGLVTVRKVS